MKTRAPEQRWTMILYDQKDIPRSVAAVAQLV
jgi:hypothetical protein